MLQLTAFTAENFSSFLSIFFVVFSIVCWYKIFEKCGEKGWYAIIPIYNKYIIFKLFMSSKLFFIRLITSIVNIIAIGFTIFNSIVIVVNTYDSFDNIGPEEVAGLARAVMTEYPIVAFIIFFCFIFIAIIDIITKYNILKSFSKGLLWFLLYLIFDIFVDAYLAFSNDEYIGNMYRKKKEIEVKPDTEPDTDISNFNE